MDQPTNAGLMQPPAPAGAPPAPAGGAPVEGAPPEEAPNVSPQEQAEYERVIGALSKVLYGDNKSHSAIMKQINPKDPFNSITMLAVRVITALDERLDIMETVILGLVPEVVDRLIELAEKSGRVQVSDRDAARIAAATQEQLMQEYETKPEDYAAMVEGVSPEEMAEYQNVYKGLKNGQAG